MDKNTSRMALVWKVVTNSAFSSNPSGLLAKEKCKIKKQLKMIPNLWTRARIPKKFGYLTKRRSLQLPSELFEFDFKGIRRVSYFPHSCSRWSLMGSTRTEVLLSSSFQDRMVGTAWCGFQRKIETVGLWWWGLWSICLKRNNLKSRFKKSTSFWNKHKNMWGKIKKFNIQFDEQVKH